jgi:hypothetical protein
MVVSEDSICMWDIKIAQLFLASDREVDSRRGRGVFGLLRISIVSADGCTVPKDTGRSWIK